MLKKHFEIADTVCPTDYLHVEISRGKLYIGVVEEGKHSNMVTDNLADITKLRDALTELIEEQQSNG